MKTLHLTLKRKWFDMIASGEKKEEYREVKPYWWTRLVQCGQIYQMDPIDEDGAILLPVDEWEMKLPKQYQSVTFRNGYSPTSPTVTVEFKGIEIGEGKPQWGAPQQPVFIIKLGDILPC